MDITRLFTTLNKIPNINSGGCGVAALAIGRCILKHYPKASVDYAYLYNSDEEDLLLSNSGRLDGGEALEAPSHIACVWDGGLFDTTGEIYWDGETQEVDEEALVKSINLGEKWCSLFDRKHIPIIAKKLSVNLSDVEIERTP